MTTAKLFAMIFKTFPPLLMDSSFLVLRRDYGYLPKKKGVAIHGIGVRIALIGLPRTMKKLRVSRNQANFVTSVNRKMQTETVKSSIYRP